MRPPTADEVARALHQGFIAREGTTLRKEDRTKVREVVAMLAAIARIASRTNRTRRFELVDAAAGKGYVGVLASKLLFEPAGREHGIVLVERDPARLAQAREAAERLGVAVTTREADAGDAGAYPEEPSLVTALHACGEATDLVLDAAIERRARELLVVPCCVSGTTRHVRLAHDKRERLGLPKAAPIAKRWVHAFVDAERLLRMEAAGYDAGAIEIAPATVTPYNVALTGRRVGEPIRAERARNRRQFLLEGDTEGWATAAHQVPASDATPRDPS